MAEDSGNLFGGSAQLGFDLGDDVPASSYEPDRDEVRRELHNILAEALRANVRGTGRRSNTTRWFSRRWPTGCPRMSGTSCASSSRGNTFTRVLESIGPEIEGSLGAQFSIFQPFIEKRREYRVFLVDGEAFCLAIETDPGTVASIDWRQGNSKNTRYHKCVLDASTLDCCRSLMKALDLRSASFDLIEDAEGVVHFIEVNQAGNFLWMEEDAGLFGVGDSFINALLNPPRE